MKLWRWRGKTTFGCSKSCFSAATRFARLARHAVGLAGGSGAARSSAASAHLGLARVQVDSGGRPRAKELLGNAQPGPHAVSGRRSRKQEARRRVDARRAAGLLGCSRQLSGVQNARADALSVQEKHAKHAWPCRARAVRALTGERSGPRSVGSSRTARGRRLYKFRKLTRGLTRGGFMEM